MKEQELYIDDCGIPLHIKLAVPDSGGTCPALLLFHGFTGHMEEPQLLAVKDAALRAGYAVIRAELYGHGKSGGSFKDHTIPKWLANAEAVTDWAKGLPEVSSLTVCGHSQGGLTAIMLAGKRPADFRGLLALSPAVSIPSDAQNGNMLGVSFDPDHIPDAIDTWEGEQLSGEYITTAAAIDPFAEARRYPGKVLIIHGGADEVIPVDYAKHLAQEFPNAELRIIEGDDHCYDLHCDEMALAAEDWLRRMK